MENSVCSHACRCFDRCLGWSRQCSPLWRLRSWHSSTGLFFRAVYTGTRPGFPRHQGGEGVAGTPGACSQVFCHSIRCISGAWQDRLPRALIICTTHTTHTATHRNTPQHTTTHRNTPQHTATHRNTPQHTATHHNTPQHKTQHNTTTPQHHNTTTPQHTTTTQQPPQPPQSPQPPQPPQGSNRFVSPLCVALRASLAVGLMADGVGTSAMRRRQRRLRATLRHEPTRGSTRAADRRYGARCGPASTAVMQGLGRTTANGHRRQLAQGSSPAS